MEYFRNLPKSYVGCPTPTGPRVSSRLPRNTHPPTKRILDVSLRSFLGCIYTRAKATSLPICCIVFNLCVYTTATAAATKIKEKNRFRSINAALCDTIKSNDLERNTRTVETFAATTLQFIVQSKQKHYAT